MTLVVNMVGGPGTGKSTTAALTFGELKLAGVNCELVTEYAKDVVWGRTTATLDNQLYIFAKQHHRLFRLLGQVDVIVTDCPLFLSLYYGARMSDAFKALVLETFREMDNSIFYLRRVKDYNPKGRLQSEAEARRIDQVLKDLLSELELSYDLVTADDTAAKLIAGYVLDDLRQRG